MKTSTAGYVRDHAAPWYREPWPWVLLGLPLTAVIAGFVTLVIAVRHEDGLVAEDYYKQGLAINRRLERERRAAELDLQAHITFGQRRATLDLSGQTSPAGLRVRFIHPTRSGNDREVPAMRTSAGVYEVALPDLDTGRWRVQIEDFDGTWRLSGDWPGGEELVLGAGTSPGGSP
jgi:hypothetical protein